MVDLYDPRNQELFKKAVADAIDAWLDKQYLKVGKWTINGLFALAVAACAYLWFSTHGFKS